MIDHNYRGMHPLDTAQGIELGERAYVNMRDENTATDLTRVAAIVARCEAATRNRTKKAVT